jgi:mono/diheme cytochrome c family protein
MRTKTMTLLMFALVISIVAVLAQGENAKIKKVPIKHTDPSSGVEMFNSYCAVCHGLDAKGNGPAVVALKTAPNDLTRLSRDSNGKFPSLRVMQTLRAELDIPAHGTKEMPMWGPLLSAVSHGRAESEQRIGNIARYIETLQVK